MAVDHINGRLSSGLLARRNAVDRAHIDLVCAGKFLGAGRAVDSENADIEHSRFLCGRRFLPAFVRPHKTVIHIACGLVILNGIAQSCARCASAF